MDELGFTYRELRKSKGITQSEVCNHLISRTTLSKFENGKLIPSISIFIELIQRIDIGFDEFMFINQRYKLNEKQQILHRFFSLFSNQKTATLLDLKKECCAFQEKSFSKTIELLIYVIDSLVELSANKEKEIPCLPKIMLSVPWEEMQKYAWWSIDDIKLMNCCLYMFPLETAIHISNQLIEQLKRYDSLENTSSLQCAIYLNVTLLCLQERQFAYAEETIHHAIHLAKMMKRYDYYALAIARKSFINKENQLFEKSLHIAHLFEDDSTYDLIVSERKLFF